MAIVTINDLKVKAHIGIEPRELKSAQDVLLDISFEYDARCAARSDDIASAVDYKAMSEGIRAFLARSRFSLLEKMAHEVLKIVTADKRVKAASVTVTKPQALRGASGVSVTVSVSRQVE
jgi:D-erythro-7,8-dihydroneopterin triphosphate epimerase